MRAAQSAALDSHSGPARCGSGRVGGPPCVGNGCRRAGQPMPTAGPSGRTRPATALRSPLRRTSARWGGRVRPRSIARCPRQQGDRESAGSRSTAGSSAMNALARASDATQTHVHGVTRAMRARAHGRLGDSGQRREEAAHLGEDVLDAAARATVDERQRIHAVDGVHPGRPVRRIVVVGVARRRRSAAARCRSGSRSRRTCRGSAVPRSAEGGRRGSCTSSSSRPWRW